LYYIKDTDSYQVRFDTKFAEIIAINKTNTIKFLCVMNLKNSMIGIISLGDIINNLEKYDSIQDITAENIMNREFAFAKEYDKQNILAHLVGEYKFIPVLDSNKKIKLIVVGDPEKREFTIGSHQIKNQKDYILIAEIGNNHNGSLKRSFELIRKAKSCGADIVKFQMRDLNSLYGDESLSHDLSTEYVVTLLKKVSLTDKEMYQCFDYCKEIGITPLCTPFDLISLDKLERYGLVGYKVASADLTNHELLTALVKTNKPLIVSTGMSNDEDIDAAISLLEEGYVNYALCHANSTYPVPFSDVHLDYIDNLKKKTRSVIGYSGHERGWHIVLGAFAKGAQIIEKHFTLDNNLEGNDHKVSLLPDDFSSLNQHLHDLSKAFGTGYRRQLSQGEAANKVALAKSLFCTKSIKRGDLILESSIVVMSPGNGLSPRYKKALIGRPSNRDMEIGDPFYSTDLEVEQKKAHRINVPKHFKWCIPVRHRDIYNLYEIFKPPVIEFHLSSKDMLIDDEEILVKPLKCEVAIHAPEQFEGDFVIDLFSDDESIAVHSIRLLNKVFSKARKISSLLGYGGKPKVIVNCGGHTTDNFLSDTNVKRMIRNFTNNVEKVDFSDCRFLAQTMPPYPWHFGGQSFHNQFTSSENINSILDATNAKIEICLDISHSYMWCSYSSENFNQFISEISPNVTHIHISDASGEAEEGLQIGEGEIDFTQMLDSLSSLKNNATLLPEVWQGHDNFGSGFKIALERLYGLRY